jgi:hypothetical protein|tara:strand:- start:990 stop:1436 length:447 start_codon:yes stop_codon:yes gene_type:complete
MKNNIVHRKSIETLCEWVNARGHQVEFQRELVDQLCYDDKTIYIHTRQGIENQLYSLLHECGHLLIYLGSEGFKKDYPMYAYAATTRQKKTKKWKVSVIGEEFEAWKRGRKLAERLNIPVDKKKYDLAMTEAMMSYFRWAGNYAYNCI